MLDAPISKWIRELPSLDSLQNYIFPKIPSPIVFFKYEQDFVILAYKQKPVKHKEKRPPSHGPLEYILRIFKCHGQHTNPCIAHCTSNITLFAYTKGEYKYVVPFLHLLFRTFLVQHLFNGVHNFHFKRILDMLSKFFKLYIRASQYF